MVDKKRLMERLFAVGNIGADENGVSRVSFTKEYCQGIKLMERFMLEENLEVKIDKVGNVIGLKKGKDPQKPVIVIGSHMDTVKNGGIYDGNLGVAAALECMAILKNENIFTEGDIIVVGFNAEEGSSLGGTFGSRSFLGTFDFRRPNLKKELELCKLSEEDILECKFKRQIKAFLELHIEQGPKLYMEKVPVGIVSGIVGIDEYKIKIKGAQNHAGTTAMKYRKDALVASSKLIEFVDKRAREYEEPFVATVGKIQVFPNMANVVSGDVEFILELRDMDKAKMDNFMEEFRLKARSLEGFEIEISLFDSNKGTLLSKKITQIAESVCNAKNLGYRLMCSGAGHDAMEFAPFVETGMIFVPSDEGISHSKKEYTSEEDIVKGTEILLETLLEVDKW